jgi:hypothetical protein
MFTKLRGVSDAFFVPLTPGFAEFEAAFLVPFDALTKDFF